MSNLRGNFICNVGVPPLPKTQQIFTVAVSFMSKTTHDKQQGSQISSSHVS